MAVKRNRKVNMMDEEQQLYLSYLLRLWPTKSDSQWVWRASLENSLTGERQGFGSLKEMFDFLEEQTSRKLTGDFQI